MKYTERWSPVLKKLNKKQSSVDMKYEITEETNKCAKQQRFLTLARRTKLQRKKKSRKGQVIPR